jgi:hypothetical protein
MLNTVKEENVMIKKLIEYRTPGSTSFVGRPQGEEVREKLSMEDLDNGIEEVILLIPGDTTSFNPSFFLGLLYNSIKKLGIEGFNKKYKLTVDSTDVDINKAISKNIDDGFRNALNSINNRDGLSAFGF